MYRMRIVMYRSAAPAGPLTPGPPPEVPPHGGAGGAPGPLDASHTPFIAVTEGEGGLDIPRLVTGADGWIQYETPGRFDRYPETEVLLARTAGTVPSGRPDGNALSPYRQAHCMLNRLCQGCGEPAERSDGSVLYVLPATRRDGSPAAFRGLSDMPPSCARCALRRCPVLSDRGRKLLWVAQAEVIGVYAEVFIPGGRGSLSDRLVPFDKERELSGAVATRYVCNLRRVSEADPAHVAELARRRSPTAAPHALAHAEPVCTRPEPAAVAGGTA
ncbi:hypothetical protein [Streptomyces sp. NPDC006267]|uniref:hypothetical protein n=1 Tax=Streptomyces sp. NPDC006267 TaxID=3157173 RepID=UPI0033A3DA9C